MLSSPDNTAHGASPSPPLADAGAAESAPTHGYTPSSHGVDLLTAAAATEADASLAKYKASLLGGVDVAAVASDAETRRVVIRGLTIMLDPAEGGRPDMCLPLDASPIRLVVKEGATYTLRITFTVHRDIVLGLTFSNRVTRMGLPVDSDTVVLGAYAPRAEPYVFDLPPAEWPSGMLARGSYGCSSTFTDADRHTHLALKWAFDIKKEWPAA